MAPILPYSVLKLMYLDKCYTHICRNIYLPLNLSLSLYLSLYLSIYLFIYLSIHLLIFLRFGNTKASRLEISLVVANSTAAGDKFQAGGQEQTLFSPIAINVIKNRILAQLNR